MSVQMTIRLDDEAATFVDQAVHDGEGSRASVINSALRREMRRRRAVRDAAIYAATADPDLDTDEYARWSAANAENVVGVGG